MAARSIGFAIVLAWSICGRGEAAMAADGAKEEACDLSKMATARELHDALAARAVEVIDRAARSGWDDDTRLADLVTADARFAVGAGDVPNWATGLGPAGAHEVASRLKADSFRFAHWVGIPRPVERPCGEFEITVEFFERQTGQNATIKFQFSDGQVHSATGWVGAFTEGQLTPSAS